jgi:hypothetical protein
MFLNPIGRVEFVDVLDSDETCSHGKFLKCDIALTTCAIPFCESLRLNCFIGDAVVNCFIGSGVYSCFYCSKPALRTRMVDRRWDGYNMLVCAEMRGAFL